MDAPPRTPTRRAALATLATLATAGALAGGSVTLAACGARRRRGGVARRIVTLAPNVTEIFFALGEGARVVGVSRYDDYPPAEVSRLPRVGGGLDPSFEAIVALRPDAVAGTRAGANRTVVDRLDALGIQTYFPDVDSLAQIRDAIHLFGGVAGVPARIDPLVARIDARIAQVRAAVRGRASPSVLAVYGQRPIVAAGPDSFANELITLANGRNVLRSGPRWPALSLEAVLALGPDVVLDLTTQDGGAPLATAWSGYGVIPAVRDGRVIRVEDMVVARPGPRVGEALAVLARAIHPGLLV